MNIIKLSIQRPIFITCLFILILAVGYISFKKLAVDLFPDVTFPVVTISTVYPGAGPNEVETLVSKVIENEVSSIGGVKALRSTNKEGVSVVIAEFALGVDVKYAEQQVRDKISSVRRRLPDDVQEPSIRRVDPADQPIITVAVSGEVSRSEIYDFANEYAKPLLQQVDQVGQVDIMGGRRREIQVQLDQDKLRQFQIPASQVAARIGAAGENIPAGKVMREKSELVYRTLAEFKSTKDIESIIVNFFANEYPVRVRDLGKVVDDLTDERARVFLNGVPTLMLFVYKQSGSNTIEVVNNLKKRITEINAELSQQGKPFQLQAVRDNSKPIQANVDDVKEAIFIGIILTIIVVLLFLGSIRSTIITGIALPNSLLGAFILMAIAGFTINIMSLLALSLAVGLLIDDAIVVRENIYRHLEMGKTPRQAAEEGTREVTLAVIATTLTVIAVFGPIGFLQGVVGQFFREFGLTVCFAMVISLADALTMAPMMSTYFAGKHQDVQQKLGLFARLLKAFDRFQTWLEDIYEKTLVFTLNFKKTILTMGVAIFALSLLSLKYIPKTFLPPQDNGEFRISYELPQGTSLDITSKLSDELEQIIRSNPEVDLILKIVGNRDGESNNGSYTVVLVPSKQRSKNTSQVKETIREQLKPYRYAKPIITDIDNTGGGGGGGGRPFTLNIVGNDLAVLEQYSQKVFEQLKDSTALKDVSYGSRPGKPEFQIKIDPEKAESFGVSTRTAGLELRTLVEGVVPAVFRQDGIEYDIRVRSMDSQRDLKPRYDKLFVPNINNKPVPVRMIAKAEETIGPATINRENRNRSISISADIAPEGPGMGGALAETKKIIEEELKLPEGVSYKFVGQAENFQELLINMAVAMGLGILFIYLVLASLYESFITPFTIMLVLPLAICGAFYALLITGKTLDMFSMIGCVLLLGVATKNSILLVDYANQLMEQGMDRYNAIIKAGKTRLRPILMTSFALIAGMLPIAIGLNEASKQRTSMGIAIIGGLISSTLLTLVVVPAAYGYIDAFGKWVNQKFKKVSGEHN